MAPSNLNEEMAGKTNILPKLVARATTAYGRQLKKNFHLNNTLLYLLWFFFYKRNKLLRYPIMALVSRHISTKRANFIMKVKTKTKGNNGKKIRFKESFVVLIKEIVMTDHLAPG